MRAAARIVQRPPWTLAVGGAALMFTHVAQRSFFSRLHLVTWRAYRWIMSSWQSVARASAACIVLAVACAEKARPVEPSPEDRTGSSAVPPPRAVEGRRVGSPVVIVAIDGVRWKEIFEGTDPAFGPVATAASAIAPNLHRLGEERGAFVGAPGHGTIVASGPNYVSLPGYSEMLSGRPSITCQSNECPRTSIPTLLDEARAAGGKVAAFSSWSVLERAASASPGAFMVSCGRSAEQPGDPFPGVGDYRPDRLTADAALAYYEAEHPDVFFLGLGDPDEYAHRGDYSGYVGAIRSADEVVGRLVGVLDRAGERGRRTHIVVTTDHGRANDFRSHGGMPEAARVWMLAVGPTFLARGMVVSPEERRLADIAPTLRRVLGFTPDRSEHAGVAIEELFSVDEPNDPP